MRILLSLALLVLAVANAGAQDAPRAFSRSDATSAIAGMRKIVVPGGIERLEKVRIGGIDQWVSIRGNNHDNPVLLMLHGGPGWVSMPTSWYFQRGWEEYFTVVQWDQRGAGKTYTENDPARIAPTMTRAQMIEDAEQLVDWLRHEFDKDKIFVLGHSWGSYLGMELVRRKPQWLHAYIGMGQMIDAPESERRGWAWTLAKARQDGNAEAIADLLSVAPYAQGKAAVPVANIMKQRQWLNYYGGMVYGRRNGDAEAAAFKLSPEYTDDDMAKVWAATDFSVNALLSEALTTDFNDLRSVSCPVLLFLGRHDINVSSTVAAEWFEQLQAPSKRLVWFENSAHEVMNEEPGKTLMSLVEYARPLAAGEIDKKQGETSASE